MDYYDSDSDREQSILPPITGRRVSNLSFMLRNSHLYPTPALTRAFRNVETQRVPNRQISHHLPLYVSNEELSNFSFTQLVMYIILSILSMRDMALHLQDVAHFDDVDL